MSRAKNSYRAERRNAARGSVWQTTAEVKYRPVQPKGKRYPYNSTKRGWKLPSEPSGGEEKAAE